MDYKEQFHQIVEQYIHREGIKEFMGWIDSTDFFTAPASTRFHGSRPGGLCEHSLRVFQRLLELETFYKNRGFGEESGVPAETLAIVSLFHDACKIGCYKTSMRNVKDERTGTWHKEPFYKFEEDFAFGGHGSKSVYLVQHFMKLEPMEATAINCHMAAWDRPANDFGVGAAFEQNRLAWLLHVADEAATYIDKT